MLNTVMLWRPHNRWRRCTFVWCQKCLAILVEQNQMYKHGLDRTFDVEETCRCSQRRERPCRTTTTKNTIWGRMGTVTDYGLPESCVTTSTTAEWRRRRRRRRKTIAYMFEDYDIFVVEFKRLGHHLLLEKQLRLKQAALCHTSMYIQEKESYKHTISVVYRNQRLIFVFW